MRSIKVVTMCGGVTGRTTKASDLSPLGDNHDTSRQVRQINNIPDDITNHQAIRRFEGTCDMTWLGGRRPGRLVFDFAELEEGRIIRE